MLQFYLSPELAEDLAKHRQKAIDPDYNALQWYAHRCMIARRKCVVVMERQSRYAMVFFGLKKQDFTTFPDLFRQRLLNEVLSITAVDSKDKKLLSNLVLNIAGEQYYQPGSDESVMADIEQITTELQRIATAKEPLPVKEDAAVAFSRSMNERPKKRRQDTDYFFPVEVFRQLWLGMFNLVNQSPNKIRRTLH